MPAACRRTPRAPGPHRDLRLWTQPCRSDCLWTRSGSARCGVVPCIRVAARPCSRPESHGTTPTAAMDSADRGETAAEVGFAHVGGAGDDTCPRSDRGAAGARGVGDHPAGRRGRGTGTRSGWSGGRRSVVESILDVPLEQGVTRGRPHRRPAARDPVPAGTRARVRGPRRRHAAGRRGRRERARVHGRRGGRGDRRRRGDLRRPRRLRDRRRRVRQARRGRHRRRDRPGRGREPGHRPPLPRHRRRLGRRQGARRLQAAARARARRLLDLRLLHRRPLPHRRQPRAARHGARRRRADEPDQRHLPVAEARATSSPGSCDFLARREGDLRALHGRRRGAEDDVRHLHRGRPGARAVPQADEPPDPHRVPPRRPHHPRPARGAARHHVRRHGHRLAGRERLPADQAVRDPGPRLLRRRAGHPRPRRGRRAGRRQPDRDPYRGRRPRRTAHRHGRRDAGARLRPGRTRSPRPTPRRAASSAPSASYLPRPCRASTSPSWSTTRTCCSR